MSDDHMLGGRLPLYESERLDPAGALQLAHGCGGPLGERCGVSGLHRSRPAHWSIQSGRADPAISSAVIELAVAERKNTSLSKRSREIIILTVGAVRQAPYELYAHCAVGRHVGLSDDAVRTLADGALPKDCTEQKR
jgi:4-carboxymuconolactone decarboxylase